VDVVINRSKSPSRINRLHEIRNNLSTLIPHALSFPHPTALSGVETNGSRGEVGWMGCRSQPVPAIRARGCENLHPGSGAAGDHRSIHRTRRLMGIIPCGRPETSAARRGQVAGRGWWRGLKPDCEAGHRVPTSPDYRLDEMSRLAALHSWRAVDYPITGGASRWMPPFVHLLPTPQACRSSPRIPFQRQPSHHRGHRPHARPQIAGAR
jgi:hypothetical protein